MAQLQAVMPMLKQWRSYLENNENYALFGGLHSYPKNGKLCWNYCSPEVDANSKRKDERRYVRQDQIDAYRKAVSLGKQLKHARALEQQLTAFADAMRSLL